MGYLNVSFPGVLRPIRCQYTDVVGLYPGVWSMTMVPQESLPLIEGPLTLTDGIETFVLPQSRIADASIRRDGNGYIVGLRGFDARWKWRFGSLHGEYNIRRADGTIIPETQKSARELIDLCFQAWGIGAADVSAAPADDYPYVSWKYDRVRPELQKLLDRYGLTVAVDWSLMRPIVVRLGFGTPLPTFPVESDVFTVDTPEAPSAIRLVCGETLMQASFKLKAVAEDLDGNVRDLESPDLSYRPAEGWEATVTDPNNPLPNGTPEAVQAAKRSVYRWYQIESFADGTTILPGTETSIRMESVLPLLPHQLGVYSFTSEGWPVNQDWYLEGRWWVGDAADGLAHKNLADVTFVPYAASLDEERGLVRLSVPLVLLSDEKRWKPAELYLICSFRLRDPTTYRYLSYSLTRTISSNATMPQVEYVPDLRRMIRARFSGSTLLGIDDNQAELDASLNALMDHLQSQYAVTAGTVRQFCGIIPLLLDGLRRQCTYVVDSDEGAYTRAALNTESEPGVPRLEELRRMALLETRRLRQGEVAET